MMLAYQGKVDFAEINLRCKAMLPSLLSQWLPDGKSFGQEWVALNPTRADHRLGSFKINMISGFWADFATGDKGGDIISLYAYLNELSQLDAARALRQQVGG